MNTGSCGIAIGDPGYAHAIILESGQNEWKPEFLRIPYDSNQVNWIFLHRDFMIWRQVFK